MMKSLALVGTLLASTGAFMAPSARRAPTQLYSEEADETTAEFRGAQAISALTADVKTQFSLEDIAKVLPHRYPFLLVDKVRPQWRLVSQISSWRGGRTGSFDCCVFDMVASWIVSASPGSVQWPGLPPTTPEEKSNFPLGLLP